MRESRIDFGKELARLRTEKGVSLEDLASATKVRTELLKNLEAGRLDGLPPAIFVEGYLKACAHHLGVDPIPLLARYRSISPQAASQPKAVEAAPPVAVSEETGFGGFKWLLAVIVLAAAGYGAYYLMERQGQAQRETEPVRTVAASLPAPEAAAEPAPEASSQAPAPAEGGPSPAEGQAAPSETSPTPQPAAQEPAPTAPVPPPAAAAGVPAAPPASQAAPAAPSGDLVLMASGPCWCEIWADGQRVLYRQVVAGDRIGFRGSTFKVNLGNAGAVELLYKGQSVPLPREQGRVVKDLAIPGAGGGSAP